MKTYRQVIACLIVLSLLVITRPCFSTEVARVGATLIVMDPLESFYLKGDPAYKFKAGRGTKFIIVYEDQSDYCVEFKKIKKEQKDIDSTAANYVEKDRRYYIEKHCITGATCQFSHGFYAAALSLPFKYRFEVSDDVPSVLSTNVDISGALGYSWGQFQLTPLIFMGLSTISLGDINSSNVETRWGITCGTGFAFAITRKFQLGFLGGWDFLTGADSNEWPFQGKLWLSVGIGYKFLDI